jgi:ABC-2 type transport system permease protein
MTVFRLYFKILKRNFFLVVIYFGVFIAITLATMNSRNSNAFSFTNTRTDVALIDYDDSDLSRGLKDYLQNYVNYKDIRPNRVDDALFYYDIKMYIEIPEGFAASLETEEIIPIGVKTIPDSAGVFAVQGIIDKYADLAYIYLKNDLAPREELIERIANQLDQEIEVEALELNQHDYSDAVYYHNYMAYVVIALMISVMGSIMLAFKPLEIKRRNHIASISDKKMNMILYLCNFILGFSFFLGLGVLSIILYSESMLTANGWLLQFNSFLFTLCIIALAYMLVTLFDSPNFLGALGTILSLGLSFITGVFIPQQFLDETILTIGKIFPTFYYVQNNALISELQSVSDISGPILRNWLIVFGFAVVFFTVSIIVSKRRQTREN